LALIDDLDEVIRLVHVIDAAVLGLSLDGKFQQKTQAGIARSLEDVIEKLESLAELEGC
jgi:hypothetical protein